MTMPKLPEPIIEGNRMLYTRAQMIEYGKAYVEAAKVPEKPSSSADVEMLRGIFGMKNDQS